VTGSVKNLDPDKVWLGVTPTLWWNDDFPSIDIGIPFEQCVSEMALAGFQGCSIGHKYPTDPAVLKRALDLRGLRVSEPWVSTYFTIREMAEHSVGALLVMQHERLMGVVSERDYARKVILQGRSSAVLPWR